MGFQVSPLSPIYRKVFRYLEQSFSGGGAFYLRRISSAPATGSNLSASLCIHALPVRLELLSIYVIDLGSAHGTFVANERLTKDTPVELEVGQSLRFAASTRSYILRKNNAALFPPPPLLTEINLPPPPDPSDEEAVVAYNTTLNRYGLNKTDLLSKSNESGSSSGGRDDSHQSERAAKRIRKMRVSFRDQVGGELVEVVGVSDGADVETEPGPLGVKEGSLVGKYESLVQITVIPKGKEQQSMQVGVKFLMMML